MIISALAFRSYCKTRRSIFVGSRLATVTNRNNAHTQQQDQQQRSLSSAKPPVAPLDPKTRFETSLAELESNALYGAGSKDSMLEWFLDLVNEGRFTLFPDYQRAYVWEPKKASRLIATVLCNRFVPPLVLHETAKGRFDIVDGKQRLTSLLLFYMNRKGAKLPQDPAIKAKIEESLPKMKSLTKLDETYEDLNGLSFDDLSPERQDSFKAFSISYTVIPRNAPPKDVFEVYEDINSGGAEHTAQQSRRAAFYGPYMRMIDDLQENCSSFHAILRPDLFRSNEYKPCNKDSDGESILRAFAFHQNGNYFKPPMKLFLNKELEGSSDNAITRSDEKRSVEKKVATLRAEFESVVKIAREVFGDSAFRKKKDGVSQTMMDAKYSTIADLLIRYK
jgi:hypothetical protein